MTKAAKFVSDPELRATLEAKDKGNANENGSIGTEATRASILAKLAASPLISIEDEKGYKEKVWKTTKSGQEFCALLPPEIIAPDISAIWSGYQADILKGDMTTLEFVTKLEIYIAERIQHIKDNPLNLTANSESCPKCKVGFLNRLKGAKGFFYACSNNSDCKTTYPEINGKPNLAPRVAVQISAVHKCKECNSGLIRRRKNKLVKGKPSYFWGCSGYPECEQVYSERGGLPAFK
jgi:DNA topoisomerase-3